MGLGGTSLPPLPPGKKSVKLDIDNKAQIDEEWFEDKKVTEEWDPAADLPDSDNEDALSGAPTAPHSQPITTPSSRQQKKRGKAVSTIKEFHSSLTEACMSAVQCCNATNTYSMLSMMKLLQRLYAWMLLPISGWY
jgi:hypothetical protein